MAEMLADDFSSDDRRRVVGAGSPTWSRRLDRGHAGDRRPVDRERRRRRSSRPAGNASSSRVLASRAAIQEHEAFVTELLDVVEINADEQIVALVTFDLDDFDAAIAELDARYVAGEAAAHAHTWSAIARGLRRDSTGRELPATTPDWVNVDHRRAACVCAR